MKKNIIEIIESNDSFNAVSEVGKAAQVQVAFDELQRMAKILNKEPESLLILVKQKMESVPMMLSFLSALSIICESKGIVYWKNGQVLKVRDLEKKYREEFSCQQTPFTDMKESGGSGTKVGQSEKVRLVLKKRQNVNSENTSSILKEKPKLIPKVKEKPVLVPKNKLILRKRQSRDIIKIRRIET